MADLPSPPVPAEADLRGHAWLALPLNAMKGSRLWLRCRRQPELAYPFFNLVFASWNQIPAGSLPEDPEFLADISGISSRAWTRIQDVVLAEWTLHSDGRLYHAAIAKEAARAWEIQKSHRTKTLAATAKRMENYHNVKKDDTIDVTFLSTRTTDRQTDKHTKRDSPPTAAENDDGFEDFWRRYGKKVGKLKTRKHWRAALKKTSAAVIIAAVELYVMHKPEPQWRLNPDGWLSGERWRDELPAPAAAGLKVVTF